MFGGRVRPDLLTHSPNPGGRSDAGLEPRSTNSAEIPTPAGLSPHSAAMVNFDREGAIVFSVLVCYVDVLI